MFWSGQLPISKIFPTCTFLTYSSQWFTCKVVTILCAYRICMAVMGSTTTDCDKLNTNRLTPIGREKQSKNILLSPEPSCSNPHSVTKLLCDKLIRNPWFAVSLSRSVDLARCHGWCSRWRSLISKSKTNYPMILLTLACRIFGLYVSTDSLSANLQTIAKICINAYFPTWCKPNNRVWFHNAENFFNMVHQI